jgi:hypothetical protein
MQVSMKTAFSPPAHRLPFRVIYRSAIRSPSERSRRSSSEKRREQGPAQEKQKPLGLPLRWSLRAFEQSRDRWRAKLRDEIDAVLMDLNLAHDIDTSIEEVVNEFTSDANGRAGLTHCSIQPGGTSRRIERDLLSRHLGLRDGSVQLPLGQRLVSNLSAFGLGPLHSNQGQDEQCPVP